MKQFSRLILVMIMLGGILLLTGCNKLNFSTFDASKEDLSTEVTTEADQEADASNNEINSSDNSETQEDSSTSSESSINSSGNEEKQDQDSNSTPTPSSIQPTENIDLPVYTVNANTSDIEPVTAAIPKSSKLTPELIVNTVVESLADQSIMIGIKNVTTKDDIVIVNFTQDNPPSKNLGSGYEGSILNAFAQSLLDNLDDYHKIIFRIDDKAYTSGAYEYGIDEVYLQE